MNQIGTLASNIWDNEFGDENSELEREIEVEGISGQLETNSLGQMNILLNSSFGLVSGDIDPVLKNEENSIMTQIYLKDWYKKQSRNILRGIGVTSFSTNKTTSSDEGSSSTESSFKTLADDWTSIREGDTTITRSRATATTVGPTSFSTVSNDSARMFKQLSQDSELRLLDLVSRYNMYQAEPLQVAGKDVSIDE
jgi:hypothetical protein